jgi:transcriptional regulator with XRE-family HTH domain
MSLEKNIRKIRRLKNLTQSQVSKELNISAQAYSKIESGETRLDTNRLQQLANIFEINVKDIYDFAAMYSQKGPAVAYKEKPVVPEVENFNIVTQCQCGAFLEVQKTIIAQQKQIEFLQNQVIFLSDLISSLKP